MYDFFRSFQENEISKHLKKTFECVKYRHISNSHL